MSTLLPVVEATLMPTILRTHAATAARIQVMTAHGEFGPVNSDSILWRGRPATLVTSASEHNGIVISKRLCSEHMKFNVGLSANKTF